MITIDFGIDLLYNVIYHIYYMYPGGTGNILGLIIN